MTFTLIWMIAMKKKKKLRIFLHWRCNPLGIFNIYQYILDRFGYCDNHPISFLRNICIFNDVCLHSQSPWVNSCIKSNFYISWSFVWVLLKKALLLLVSIQYFTCRICQLFEVLFLLLNFFYLFTYKKFFLKDCFYM